MKSKIYLICMLILFLPIWAISQINNGIHLLEQKSDSIFTADKQIDISLMEDDDEEQNYQEFDLDNELEIRIKGFLDTYHAIRSGKNFDWMSSRTRARGEFIVQKGQVGMFLSLNAIYNSIVINSTGLELREAYLYFNKGDYDIKAGRQIIIWGVADALRITDQISPMDYTEFITQDYDDIRIPVNAFKLKFSQPKFSLEFVLVPVSDYFIFPTDTNNPWAINVHSNKAYRFDLESTKPIKKFSNIEFGGRFRMFLRGFDFSMCVLQTWNKIPAFSYTPLSDNTLLIRGNYHRMTMIGGDFSLPIENFVIRGEGAIFLNEEQNAKQGYNTDDRNSISALLGIDWYPGNDWNLSIQYNHKYIAGDLSSLSVLKNSNLATVRFSKEFLRNTLKCSSFAYLDVTNKGFFNRLSISYDLNDQISIIGGYDYFHANKGIFNMYRNNSEIWIKAKYSF